MGTARLGSHPRITRLRADVLSQCTGKPYTEGDFKGTKMSTVCSLLPKILSSHFEMKPSPAWSPFGSPLFRSFTGDVMELERVAKLWPMASWEGELHPWVPFTGVAVCPKAVTFVLQGYTSGPWGRLKNPSHQRWPRVADHV